MGPGYVARAAGVMLPLRRDAPGEADLGPTLLLGGDRLCLDFVGVLSRA